METSCIPLPPSQRAKLLSAGYSTLGSLSNVSHTDLAREIGVTDDEALEILNLVWQSNGTEGPFTSSGTILTGAKTAWDLLRQETTRRRIVTGCNDLDSILGGGICPREVTELDGVPGIGKTQLGIQLAVNVQISPEFEGLGGQAVYIDTEGSFMVERVSQIAKAYVKKFYGSKSFAGEVSRQLHDDILENIFYFRACSSTDQIAVTNYMDKFIEEHNKVKLLIVDSVTFHFRQDFDDLALRARILAGMAQKLMKLAEKFDVAVVLMNQVTTKYSGGSFQLAPALGESWSHACTNRIILYWNDNKRLAYIDKSPSLQSASAPFLISAEGICNLETNQKIEK